MGCEFHVDDLVLCYCDEFDRKMEARILQFREAHEFAYVHFTHQDKRLDKWVAVDDLEPFSRDLCPPEEERTVTRSSRRLHDHGAHEDDELLIENRKFETLHKEVTKVRNIDAVTIGSFTIRAWYYSPYPPPYHDHRHLYICEFCLIYFTERASLDEHLRKSRECHPPGREIYRKGDVSIFELTGRRQKVSCQCLCLLAKLFLDHKTLFYDVEGFVFYVLCQCDSRGAHVAAYYSRELESDDGNILACIVALPPYQKRGYGRLLISLSYEIAKRQKIAGGPERPLSDLGRIAFRVYWKQTLVEILRSRAKNAMSLDDLERITAIRNEDIVEVLREMSCIVKVKGEWELNINKEALAAALAEIDSGKRREVVDPNLLIWMPPKDEQRSV
jgi:histone acetyltransferase MYST1